MTRKQARDCLTGHGYEARVQAALEARQRQCTGNTCECRS
jgi:hypothetical protein